MKVKFVWKVENAVGWYRRIQELHNCHMKVLKHWPYRGMCNAETINCMKLLKV